MNMVLVLNEPPMQALSEDEAGESIISWISVWKDSSMLLNGAITARHDVSFLLSTLTKSVINLTYVIGASISTKSLSCSEYLSLNNVKTLVSDAAIEFAHAIATGDKSMEINIAKLSAKLQQRAEAQVNQLQTLRPKK